MGITQHIANAEKFNSEVPQPIDTGTSVEIALNIGKRLKDPTLRPPEAQPPKPMEKAKERQIFYQI